MSALREKVWTVEEYLELEHTSEEKHEYLDGHIYLMAGASRKHLLISGNIYASLHAQLRKRPCEIYQSDMRVKADRLYTYPDIVVVCDTPQFIGEAPGTLINPILIVEVLSPSTEGSDRRKKFQDYRALESLQEYLLVEQDSHQIEHYIRQKDGQWLLSDAVELEKVLELPSIGCTLALADVYEKVTFDKEEA
jgi:Uma2 family endonuclease